MRTGSLGGATGRAEWTDPSGDASLHSHERNRIDAFVHANHGTLDKARSRRYEIYHRVRPSASDLPTIRGRTEALSAFPSKLRLRHHGLASLLLDRLQTNGEAFPYGNFWRYRSTPSNVNTYGISPIRTYWNGSSTSAENEDKATSGVDTTKKDTCMRRRSWCVNPARPITSPEGAIPPTEHRERKASSFGKRSAMPLLSRTGSTSKAQCFQA